MSFNSIIEEPGLERELMYKTTRSRGKGGQHVNKVESRVELYFDVMNSAILDEQQKDRILKKLPNRISKNGVLMISSEEARTQFANKKLVTARFYLLLHEALKVPRKRKPSKPTKAALEKRLKEKKKRAEVKISRRKP